MNLAAFPEKLRKTRELRKLSQSELAERCGLQPAVISHFETGKREPSLTSFTKLCEGLRVHPGVLLSCGGESLLDTLTMEEFAFIKLVEEAVVAKHKKDIKQRRDREDQEPEVTPQVFRQSPSQISRSLRDRIKNVQNG